MAGKKENIKSLFSNSRTRVIIIFTAVLLAIAVIVGYVKLRAVTTTSSVTSAVSHAPGGIQSIPGALNQTAQYAKLQQEQNITQAMKAQQTGGSAIPTIIKTQALGEGVGVIGSQGGQSGVGFATLARENEEGAQKSLWLQTLQNAGCSKDALNQVISQGAQLSDINGACTCAQLKDNGYNLKDLNPICACKELRAAGYSARQLKDAGYTAARLRDCGFNACELRNAGFTAQEMKDAGFSDDELKGAGYTPEEITKASGLPAGITAADVLKAGCSVEALTKLRKSGVSASAIRRISGCSINQLKAAGFTAQELRNAGFSAADLKRAGFTPEELRAAGYTARDLLNAGFTPSDLTNAGYTAADIKAAGVELPPGITPDDVKKAGCDVDALKREKAAGVSAALIRQSAGCSAQALKAAGFTDQDLANAGFTPQEMSTATPLTDAQINAAGCNPDQLKKLFAAGVSAKRIKELNGCSADALKKAGYDVKSLLDAGFTPQQLLAAGFFPKDLENAGLSPIDILANGRVADCSVESLKKARAAGVSALTIKKTLGCSAKALKDAGYSAKDLKDAGFTAAELKDAGFSAKDLKDAGFSAKDLRDAGFSANDLKDAGFSAKDLKDAGFSASDLKAAGFGLKDLKDAGFSAKDLKAAGFSARELKDAGFSARVLKDAGFNAAQLKGAGFGARDLVDAGFSAGDLQGAGFSPTELQNAGLTPEGSQVAGLGNPNIQQGAFNLNGIPSIGGAKSSTAQANAAANSQQLQAIINSQNQQMAEQRYQQKIQQKSSDMIGAANQMLAEWRNVPSQSFVVGSKEEEKAEIASAAAGPGGATGVVQPGVGVAAAARPSMIKMGDVLFAVIDTSVNSDEPGPILATIVSGQLKGAKLIGSFNVPANANKMVITFNNMSIPGAPKTISITAYAIDSNTARTALSSRTDHHYLMRYGSLFASSFLEGFGNAFQSANTTVTIGGTGGGNNVTIANGFGRSTLENAVIGLATVGKTWGQQAQLLFNTPTTVEVFAGTPVGVLFTQDIQSI
ncbi:MAG: type IVB secretion system protein DotG/IcmE [Legionella sp.]